MAAIMRFYDSFQSVFDKHGDPRTASWFLMSSPLPTLSICLSYVFVVKVLGPKLMENRKPFQLKNALIVYNLFQVIFSSWLFYEMVHACWWYYFSKFTEFMDTIFFVLRKKNQHVSTLHVIHHGCMPMSVWFGVKFTPGGHSTFFGLLNTFVHIIMYSYYLLAALGPQIQKYLWWKKYLTSLQMVQFVAIMVHAFQLLFIDCNYPRAFVWWIGLHAVMFFFLFKEFYNQQYNKPKKGKQAEAVSANGKSGETTKANGHSANGFNKQAADYYASGGDLIHRPQAAKSK
ncbi:elongation of very long chain fatty acids protein AAEL008004 isoform X3 [Nilaparvata lugens]|uniref:elongation of very long chain fatty acids protein AAEL008004 isoform X3 n=1 Tax=Nilaparvata lugens TaxID=108931 RepID=UPI00193DAABE|nr:elongation of very long chain fatty acids protein AAEL008004 isoform X3 [Nilaparvata lugens]XP_039296096.1 elongation of very long chain fatty acids protein AAEL008004 isoform X3 [Nilaparvata lugens]XP_039296097.1 elongation of very long chain fatty acids protein AAEL008004 isoform X3 [Nilaparvata lugens]